MKQRDVVINIQPYNCEVEILPAGFILKFTARMTDSRRKIVKIHLQNWWCRVIAKRLWQVIQYRRDEVKRLEDGMNE